jgi:hypothetical protein
VRPSHSNTNLLGAGAASEAPLQMLQAPKDQTAHPTTAAFNPRDACPEWLPAHTTVVPSSSTVDPAGAGANATCAGGEQPPAAPFASSTTSGSPLLQ